MNTSANALWNLGTGIGGVAASVGAALGVLLAALFFVLRMRRRHASSVAFFHPYCMDGGGGERVLWCAVRAVMQRHPHLRCVIYCFNTQVSEQAFHQRIQTQFGITLQRPVELVMLHNRWLLEATTYPVFTMLGQSIGSMFIGFEALLRHTPTVFLDTMGYAFTYPLAKFAGCRVGAYVHYPTISTDMLQRVRERRPTYNNSALISSTVTLSSFKLWYYQLFAYAYGFVGKFAKVVMVNSTWTKNHIDHIWHVPQRTHVVFPPCNTSAFQSIPLGNRRPFILSIAQFREEKNHALQLHALHALFEETPALRSKTKLILIGGARHPNDLARVKQLRALAEQLGVTNNVQFEVNIPYSKLREWLSCAVAGIHTMWCEHFGIGIVEFMAAGVVPVAHNSGGPKTDIVVPKEGVPTGFLASSDVEYAQQLKKILCGEVDNERIASVARQSANRFSEEVFDEQFQRLFAYLV